MKSKVPKRQNMMLYREISPHVALRRFVQCFWVWRTDSSYQWGKRERILPDGCTELLFDFADPAQQTDSDVNALSKKSTKLAGQLSSAIEFQPIGAMDILGVRFYAHGIFPFLNHPLVEITDRVVALHEIWNDFSNELWPMLHEASGDRQRIKLVEHALLTLVRKQDLHPDVHVKNAVECIASSNGLISIERLARELGLGRRQLERKFVLQVGVSPKLYTRIIRLRKFLSLVQRAGEYEWPSVVFDCGFYDQSHLIRDFKALSGQTPSEFFGSDHAMARMFLSGQCKTHFYNTP